MTKISKSKPSAPSIDLAVDLLECLTHLESADASKPFALFETQNNPPNPGICLKNGGPIGLPLSDGDANVFRAASHRSPLDRDPVSPVGECVWVIPAGEFEIQNPTWEPFLQDIVTKVSAGLGVDSNGKGVSAELFNLSLREAGPMPISDRGTRSPSPRVFGTLAIILPSRHEGGEIYISHGGTRVFETSQSSAFDASYIAWFSDVAQEIKPISAGRRLVLTYNLVHSTLGPDVLRADSNKSMAKLDLLFSYWKENIEEETSMLAYLLEDDVKDEKLSYSELEGNNLQVVTYLRQAAEKYGFCLYLANMKRSIEAEGDDDYDDRFYEREIDQSQAESILKRVVELDGTEIAKGMEFGDEMLIEEEPFEGVEPDDEEDSGTVVYFRTVVLVMPKQYRIDYFLTPSFPHIVKTYWGGTEMKGTAYTPDVTGWIDRLSTSFNQSGDSGDRQDLEQICKLVTNAMQNWKKKEAQGIKLSQPYSSADIARVVAAFVDLDNKDLFLETFEMCPYKVPASTFKSVGAALLRYGLNSLLPKLSLHVTAFNELSDRFDIINAVQEGLVEEIHQHAHVDATSYQTWVYEEADRAISDMVVTVRSAKDGVALANYCKALARPDIFNNVLPAVKRNIGFIPMTLAFQLTIFAVGTEGHMPQDIARDIFAEIMSAMLDGFRLHSLGILIFPAPPTAGIGLYSRLYREPDPVFHAERSRNIALLVCHCHTLQLTTELNILVSNLVEEAKVSGLNRFDLEFLPFLKVLGSTVQELNVSMEQSPLQYLFQQVLSMYIERYVGLEPHESKDWSRPTVICDCQDCPALNRFLADPTQKVGSFRIPGKRRDHMLSKVSDTGIDQYIDKTKPSSFSLVLTKNKKYFEIMHKAWEERCIVAKNQLQAVDAEVGLKSFLADFYGPIVSLSIVSGSATREHRKLPLPSLAAGGNHIQGQNLPQPPLAPISNNIQGRQLPALSSIIAAQWSPLPPPGSNGRPETRIVPQGTKRKASEGLEQNPKRTASEVIVIDD
ncbi:hypothetical protein N431DRAFT_555630 [Stipitochalara longipes BDJ]|nr:hypothetical protein N431DRAFT_555630 [Stipitochalara longipes BDJ]